LYKFTRQPWAWYGYSYGWQEEHLSKVDDTYNVTGVGSLDVMIWNPYYSPIILHAKALKSDFVSTIQPMQTYKMIVLAPCSYDVFVFCKFGIVPILLLAAVIVTILYFYWRN
jgi:hypothetical protein